MGRKYTKRTWTVEHTWTCNYCGFINKGRNDKCERCGKHIDGTHTEHVPSDMSYENRVTDTNRFDNKNPDWICVYCNARNSDSRSDCHECGSQKGEKKGTASSGQRTEGGAIDIKPTGETVNTSPQIIPPAPEKPIRVTIPPSAPIPREERDTTPPPRERKHTIYRDPQIHFPKPDPERSWLEKNFHTVMIVLGVTGAIVLFVWLMYWLFAMHETRAQINNTQWHYHVSLRQRSIAHDHDWQNEMHGHAFNVSCATQIRSYHDCDPYDCNPHQVGYDCNCHSVESCHPVEHCHNVCTSNGNRSSSCSEECEESEECTSSRECSTCYRTEYDTCYHRCPDYDQMCDYDYPAWNEVNYADNTQHDHTIVRPNLSAIDNVSCPSDPEELYIQNHSHTQCTTDSVEFLVDFNAGSVGQYQVHPSSVQEYNQYQTGDMWQCEYNHAGTFHPLRTVGN